MFEYENFCSRSAQIFSVTGEIGHPHVVGMLWLCGSQGKEKQDYYLSQGHKAQLQFIFAFLLEQWFCAPSFCSS